MIALRLLPLSLLIGTAAHSEMAARDVPPPRALKPIGLASVQGPAFAPALYRDTPAVLYGSSDRYVPIQGVPRLPACRAAALIGMMRDDDANGFGGDEMFADMDVGGFEDDFLGR